MQPDRPPRILLVEDDDAQARVFECALEAAEIASDLRHARDGDAAIDQTRASLAERCGFDLIILDLHLPPAGGLAVLDVLKSDPVLCTIPVVVFSSSRHPADRRGAYERHANSYIVKPDNFDVLQNVVRDVIRYWTEWNEPLADAG